MQDRYSKMANVEVRRTSTASASHVSAPSDQVSSTQLSDDELLDYYKNLPPPPEVRQQNRLDKLLPGLKVARANGHSLKSLAADLAKRGIKISHVTLGVKLGESAKKKAMQEAESLNGEDNAGDPVHA